jgi:hypothetical protein
VKEGCQHVKSRDADTCSRDANTCSRDANTCSRDANTWSGDDNTWSGDDNTYSRDAIHRRKIRLIEGNAKCRHLKKLTCKGTLRQVFICLRPRTPYPTPLHTVYVYMYSILIHTGKGEI